MDLLRLEQQRQALEVNLQQLRSSLRHWHLWEAEYEQFKEALLLLKSDVTPDVLSRIAQNSPGELVTEKEVRDLSGLSSSSPRSVTQIIGMIDRRQEYVQKNIETIQRQFFEAEAKQEELAFASATHGGDGDGETHGLPLTEIHEELDEDDNVISSKLIQPEEDTAQVVEALRKAGVPSDELRRTSSPTRNNHEDLKPAITNIAEDHPDPNERPSIRKKSVSFTADTKEPLERPRPESEDGRKSVSFAEKVAVMPAAPLPDTRSVSFSTTVEEIPAQPLGTIPVQTSDGTEVKTIPVMADPSRQTELRQAFKPGERVVQLNDENEIESVQVVLPENESPEDAATRREMLEYHLNEVGNVVAQIDLEEANAQLGDDDDDDDDASSFYTSSEYLDDEDTPYTTGHSDSEEDEDEHGRTNYRVITPEYRKEMLELEKRLIGNLGPDPKDEVITDMDAELDPANVHRLVIRNQRSSISSASSDNSDKKPAIKKHVSFAESVEIAQPASPPSKAQKHFEGEHVSPITEKVSERTTATSSLDPTSITANRSGYQPSQIAFADTATIPETFASHGEDASEMQSENESAEAADSTGPPGRTLADTLTERTPSHKSATAPSEEDSDPILERRQLATEYYRRRNDIIKQQGGFQATPDDDDTYGELMEERDGKLKKVSRFKAARIKPQDLA